jgi:hypothetical protein
LFFFFFEMKLKSSLLNMSPKREYSGPKANRNTIGTHTCPKAKTTARRP